MSRVRIPSPAPIPSFDCFITARVRERELSSAGAPAPDRQRLLRDTDRSLYVVQCGARYALSGLAEHHRRVEADPDAERRAIQADREIDVRVEKSLGRLPYGDPVRRVDQRHEPCQRTNLFPGHEVDRGPDPGRRSPDGRTLDRAELERGYVAAWPN